LCEETRRLCAYLLKELLLSHALHLREWQAQVERQQAVQAYLISDSAAQGGMATPPSPLSTVMVMSSKLDDQLSSSRPWILI